MTCVIALKLRDENGPLRRPRAAVPQSGVSRRHAGPPARTAPVPTWSPTGSSRRSGTWSSTDDVRRPYLTPLNAESQAGLPPAILVTKGFDPLRDVGHAYAQKLAAAGNDLTYIHNPDLTHGFPQFTGTQPPATKRRSSWPTTSRPRSADPTVTWHRPATQPHE